MNLLSIPHVHEDINLQAGNVCLWLMLRVKCLYRSKRVNYLNVRREMTVCLYNAYHAYDSGILFKKNVLYCTISLRYKISVFNETYLT